MKFKTRFLTLFYFLIAGYLVGFILLLAGCSPASGRICLNQESTMGKPGSLDMIKQVICVGPEQKTP